MVAQQVIKLQIKSTAIGLPKIIKQFDGLEGTLEEITKEISAQTFLSGKHKKSLKYR